MKGAMHAQNEVKNNVKQSLAFYRMDVLRPPAPPQMYGATHVFDIHLNVMSNPRLFLLNCSKTRRSTFNPGSTVPIASCLFQGINTES